MLFSYIINQTGTVYDSIMVSLKVEVKQNSELNDHLPIVSLPGTKTYELKVQSHRS